jgi:hypothetical protein
LFQIFGIVIRADFNQLLYILQFSFDKFVYTMTSDKQEKNRKMTIAREREKKDVGFSC